MARKYNLPVIIMEPVKGGMLATPPKTVAEVFDKADSSKSYASFAIKFAANHVWKLSFFVLKHFRKKVKIKISIIIYKKWLYYKRMNG